MSDEATSKAISWRDCDGMLHVRDDIPSDAVCLGIGETCPLDGRGPAGRVLTIGSSTVVCTNAEHRRPARIVVYMDDTRREVMVEERIEAVFEEIRDHCQCGARPMLSETAVALAVAATKREAQRERRPCSTCGKPGCSPMEHAGWDPNTDPQR